MSQSMTRDLVMRVHRALCSPLVDAGLYRAAMGAGQGDLTSVGQYLARPVLQRPNLSVYFDREFYLATNPDVLQSGEDPLVHFIETGLASLRAPHPLIDLRYIAGEDAHVLGSPPAMRALLDLLDYDLMSSSPYFDLPWYTVQLGPLAPSSGILKHFLSAGLAAGMRPNAWLEPAWYAAGHEDVPKQPYQAMRHFIVAGDAAGRAAGPAFDGQLYRRRYVDVADSGIPPLRHFLLNGRHEGRQAPSDRRRSIFCGGDLWPMRPMVYCPSPARSGGFRFDLG